MGADITSMSNVLKEDYRDPIRELLNNRTVLLGRLKRNTEDVSGLEAYIPLHTTRNEGLGARGENGTLPTAGNQGYDKATFKAKYNYGRIEVSGPAIATAKSDSTSFTRAVDSEVQGLTRDMPRDFNRQLFGLGDGLLAIAKTESNSDSGGLTNTTFVAEDPTPGYTTNPAYALRHLNVKREIDIRTRSSGAVLTNGAGRSISAITKSTRTVALTGITATANLADVDGSATGIYRKDSWNKEIFGLAAAISDADPGNGVDNFGGIARSGKDWWQAQNLNNSGTLRPFGTNLLEDAFDAVDINSSSGETTLLLSNHKVYNQYFRYLVPDRRYMTSDGTIKKLDGGFEYLEYNGVPWVKDRDCQPGTIYGLDESTLMLFVMADWDWMDKDGAVLSRVKDKDAYEATIFGYHQLGCDNPPANFVIKDIDETT